MSYQCPKCQSENIRRVSEIYREGVQTGSMSHYNTNSGERTKSSVTTISAAARQVAPPKKARAGEVFAPLKWATIVFICLLPVGCAMSVASLHGDEGSTTYGLIGGFSLLIAFGVYIPVLVKGLSAAKLHNSTVYAEQYARWERMWKCNRCGEFFLDEDMDAA